MGNQGMTNWKFSMFFVIALTLVAGLFADTALAGNGDGTMIRSLTIPTDAVLIPDEEIVKAGTIDVAATDNVDEGLGLKFTYMADGADGASPIDMNGGTVRLKIHPDWKIGIDNIESVSDGTTGTTTLLYLRGAKLTDVAEDAVGEVAAAAAPSMIRGPALKSDRNNRRIKLDLDADGNVTYINVELDGFDWGIDRATGRKLTITLARVTVPIPVALSRSGRPVKTYEFTAYSGAPGSTPRKLKPDNDVNTDTHPIVEVGNIDSDNAIEVSVSPAKAYVGDEASGKNAFKVTIKALGPIYDVDTAEDGFAETADTNYNVQIVVSGLDTGFSLLPKPAANETATEGAPTTIRGNSGYVSLKYSNGVAFVNSSHRTVLGGEDGISTDGTVTINIKRMDKDDTIILSYDDVWFDEAVAAPVADVAGDGLVQVTVNSDGSFSAAIGKGEVAVKPGSGTIKFEDPVAQINTREDITITYTAATSIANAYLVVQIPETPASAFKMPNAQAKDDTDFIPLTLTFGSQYPDVSTLADDSSTDDIDESIHPNGATAGSRYGRIDKSSGSVVTRLFDSDSGGDTAYDTVVWGPLSLASGKTFVGRIRNVRITDEVDEYPWDADLVIPPTGSLSDPVVLSDFERDGTTNLPDAAGPAGELFVVQAGANPVDPDVTFEITEATALPLSTAGSDDDIRNAGLGGFSFYDAAGRYRLKFTFTAKRTPLKQGKVSFALPTGWSPPTKTAGTEGYIKIDGPGTLDDPSGQRISISELDLDIDASTSVIYGAVNIPADARDDDMVGAVVHHVAGEVTIESEFDVDGDGSIRKYASNEIGLTVGNVAAGSGTATMRDDTVEAGSIVSPTVVYEAQGTMDGGQVALQMPPDWGDLQNENDTKDNYVQVTSSGGTLGDWATSGDTVEVILADFDKGDTVRFALKNVVAQPSNIGVTNFTIYSAGEAGDSLEAVVGEEPPDGAYTNAGEDLSKLLGRVYQTDCLDDPTGTPNVREDYNGYLRIAVTGGGDGGGEVAVEIVDSEHSGIYIVINDDGEEEEQDIHQLHAGDADKRANLLFTYTPIETIIDGELKFTVPSGWADPQTSSPSRAGFTVVSSGGTTLPPDASGDSVTVSIPLINRNDTIVIDYGAESGGVTPPTSVGPETFTFAVQGSETGKLKELPSSRQPVVDIRPQATGKGTATVEASGKLYAGSAENSVTITYTSAGQVVDGDLRITVPENWSLAQDDHFASISGGTPTYGGDLTDAQRADDDPVDNDIDDDAVGTRQLIVRGIDLRAGGSYSVTYEDVTVQATALPDVEFKIEFRGNSGPGVDFGETAVLFPEGEDKAQLVDVLDVEPGSGTVEVRGPAVVTVGLTAYEITIIYTADAQISAEKAIAVQIPIGWSDPIDDDAAMDDDGNYNEGTYTVVHKNADGTSFTDRYGDPTDGMVEKADVADRMLMASVTGDGVAAGETVIFTFQNATAPADAGPSTFQVYYDEAKVESDDDVVLVQSGEGAAMLALSSEEGTFIIDDGGSLTVTVMLQADDGSAATRAVDTVIALESSSDNGSFDPATVTIAAGETMGTSDYSDGSVGSVEITASTDATDVAAADALTITANTEMPMLESVDFSPKVAKDLTTITVTAVGTAFQNPTFMIEDINFSGISMEEDAGDGTYTGSHRLARGSTEGMHSVTVTINGVSLAADDMLTVDNTMPSVTVTAPAAGITVINGQEITITATVTDATDVTVTADVSMLDSEAEADSVMLTDGTGMHTIDMNNSNLNDEYTITVTATDAAGNVGVGMVTVMLDNTRSFTSMIPSGLSMFHVPLDVDGMDTIGDLKAALGDDVISAIPYHGGKWEPDSDDVEITADLGMFLVTKGAIEHEFVGHPWGGGSAMISVTAGANNLIGVPVADPNVTMISDIIGLFPADVVQTIVTASGDGEYPQISGADDPDDAEVKGDAAYLVIAASDGSAMVSGAGWSTGGMASAAPIALSGYQLDTQTPLISVYGSVVDEITGLAREGFRAKVKNLSTKAALSEITSVEAADGYSITFVDLTDAHAARVGDVLEISADSPDPLVGVKPVRHIVTVDDVKNSRIELESLIAYEIPAETELLRNYPNPFNPETWIPYRLAEDADVSLTIYDTNGATVRSIDIGHQIAAVYDTRAKAIYWDGRNRFGEQVASGLYFYHLSAGDFSGTRRMVILK